VARVLISVFWNATHSHRWSWRRSVYTCHIAVLKLVRLLDADQAELRRLLAVVYADTTTEPESAPARVW
jgi:hypothetical protein